MKILLLILLSAAIMVNAAWAEKLAADKVPAAVKDAFKAKFPSIKKASWEMENSDYEANFKVKHSETSANFDETGKWLETETEIEISALPAPVQAALKKDFAAFKIHEAARIEISKNDNAVFEAEIKKGKEAFDVLFKADGTVLSQTKLEMNQEKD